MAKLTLEYWEDDGWLVGRLVEVPGIFRAWQKITCHFRIPSSGHLHPIFNPKVLKIAHYSCGFELSDRTSLT